MFWKFRGGGKCPKCPPWLRAWFKISGIEGIVCLSPVDHSNMFFLFLPDHLILAWNKIVLPRMCEDRTLNVRFGNKKRDRWNSTKIEETVVCSTCEFCLVPFSCNPAKCKQGCSANKRVVGTHAKTSHLKQLQTHFKAKFEKGVGTPFPRIPTPLHPLCN